MVHDVCNLLTIVFSKVDDLTPEKIHPSCREDVLKIKTTLERVRMLLLSAKRQLEESHTIEKFRPAEEIDSALELVKIKSDEYCIDIRSDINSKVTLRGDTVRFYQIVLNLLLNAVESYENYKTNKKLVEISLEKIGKSFVLEVKDYGKGIDKRQLKHIFEPFFTTRKRRGGTGIGLYLTKEYVEELFKGKIKISSKKRSGTSVKVEIPLKNK